MVEIIEYCFEENQINRYVSLIQELYPDCKGVQDYIKNTLKFLDKKNPFFLKNEIWNFIALENQKPVGHISAIIDKRLANKKIGIIGFFECIEDKKIFSKLLTSAAEKLKSKNCEIIRGPINLTIWHQYRFAIEQDPKKIFYFEPLSRKYYDKFFKEEGFSFLEEYYSAERTNFDAVINLTRKDYENAIKEGYKIRTIKLEDLTNELKSIYLISKEIFSGSENYIEISEEEFMFLYSGMKEKIFADLIEIISNPSGEDVGFCFSIPDLLNPGTVILKTIAIKNTERRKGLGAALLYSQHFKAKNLGFSKYIYALIRENNAIKKLPYPDAKIIARYRTYNKSIK